MLMPISGPPPMLHPNSVSSEVPEALHQSPRPSATLHPIQWFLLHVSEVKAVGCAVSEPKGSCYTASEPTGCNASELTVSAWIRAQGHRLGGV